MHISNFLALSWLSHTVAAALTRWEAQTPLVALDLEYTLRPATEDDLDGLLDTIIAAFKPGPMWQYINFDDEKYVNYTWTCNRLALQEQWENLDPSTAVNVVTVPVDDEDRIGATKERVVSVGAWTWQDAEDFAALSIKSILSATHDECSDRRDQNITREEDFEDKLERAIEPYAGNVTERHMFLAVLATHPDWDGNGFGAAQLQVGLKNATLADVPITLVATPAGYPLYESLGFQSIGNLTIEMLDDLGVLWQEYMRWDAPKS